MSERAFTMADLDAARALVERSKTRLYDLPLRTNDLRMMDAIAGVRVVTSVHMTERVQHSRSPSRARRRATRGHPQNFITAPSSMAYRLQDGTLVMHPARYDEIKSRIDSEVRGFMSRQ